MQTLLISNALFGKVYTVNAIFQNIVKMQHEVDYHVVPSNFMESQKWKKNIYLLWSILDYGSLQFYLKENSNKLGWNIQ
uniref:Uncharacterized protein n=1 Tax=Rhizophagus irregularis (strain DAOM 181602 / DAOM 197198 / MUCL 43194) TaxID=747089 RepID=U9UU90_RHIID